MNGRKDMKQCRHPSCSGAVPEDRRRPPSSDRQTGPDLSELENAMFEGVRQALSDVFYEHDVAMDRVGSTASYSVPLACPCTYCNGDSDAPEVLHCSLELRRRPPDLTGDPLYMIYVRYLGGVFCESWEGEPEAIPARVAFIVGVMSYHAGLQAGMLGL